MTTCHHRLRLRERNVQRVHPLHQSRILLYALNGKEEDLQYLLTISLPRMVGALVLNWRTPMHITSTLYSSH